MDDDAGAGADSQPGPWYEIEAGTAGAEALLAEGVSEEVAAQVAALTDVIAAGQEDPLMRAGSYLVALWMSALAEEAREDYSRIERLEARIGGELPRGAALPPRVGGDVLLGLIGGLDLALARCWEESRMPRIDVLMAALGDWREVLARRGRPAYLMEPWVLATSLYGAGSRPGAAPQLPEALEDLGGLPVDGGFWRGQLLLRLAWLEESLHAGHPALPGWPAEALPAGPEGRSLALRLAQQIPVARHFPDLGPLLHERRERLVPAAVAIRPPEGFEVHREAEVVDALCKQALEARRFPLDHLAIVEVGQAGVREIVLTPELVLGPGHTFGVLVDHEAGVFCAEVQVARGGSLRMETAGATDEEFDELLRTLVAAVYRDLVVAEVRERHLVVTGREATGVSRQVARQAQRRGQALAREAVRYLPRVVWVRRQEAAERRPGERAEPRAHMVGAHLRRLSEGQVPGEDAETYAREIGLPLRGGYTVVAAHARGGSEAERAALMTTEVKRWRSWSALEYLRVLMQPAPHAGRAGEAVAEATEGAEGLTPPGVGP